MRKGENLVFRRRSVEAFFRDFTVWHRPFVRELAERYYARCIFPFIPLRQLALCYSDAHDIEVAALVGVLLKDDRSRERRVREFRVMMGRNPGRWFDDRVFMSLASSGKIDRPVGGAARWRIIKLMDDVHSERHGSIENIPVLPSIIKDVVRDDSYYGQLWMLRCVLSLPEPFGMGVWHIPPLELRCPLVPSVLRFLKTFFPDYRLVMSADDAIGLMGLERDVDFLFAAYGWDLLCVLSPKECRRYVSVYQKRYREFNITNKRSWVGSQGIVPVIDFG